MPELGRKCVVLLLDDHKVEIVVQPVLQGSELLDLVASHFNLKEKEYFGLCLEGTESMPQWLELDRPVLEQDVPPTGILKLRLQVRYYIESLSWLQDAVAVELFYYQCKQNVFRDLIQCDSQTVFELAGHVLQATFGDFSTAATAKEDLKRLPVIPASTLKEHPDTNYCESEIIRIYEHLSGRSRGIAIISYLNSVISQPTYGLHCYEVKDRTETPYLLGLSPKGLAVFEPGVRSRPKKLYEWKNLENIYHRDKKFSIEVYSQSPSDSGTTQRTGTSRNMCVLVWFSNNPRLLRSLFNTAKGQHQLYLSKRAARSVSPTQCRTPTDIAQELSASSSVSLNSSTLTGSTNSLVSSGSRGNTISEEAAHAAQEAARLAEREMYLALLSRRDTLKQQLMEREEELIRLNNKEAKILARHQKAPPVNATLPSRSAKQVGTSFTYSEKIVNPTLQRKNTLEDLQKEVEIQQKIVDAAQKLCHEKGLSRSVKKERKESCEKLMAKLRQLQTRLDTFSRQSDLSRSVESGMDDPRRPSSPAVSTHSAPSTMSPSPMGSPIMPKKANRDEKFSSVDVEDYVAALIAGDHRVHLPSRATASTVPALPSSHVQARAGTSRPTSTPPSPPPQVIQPSALPQQRQRAMSNPNESIIPMVRRRMQSLARNRDSFMMNDPLPNGISSNPDSSSSEDEATDTLPLLNDQQLFGQGTLV